MTDEPATGATASASGIADNISSGLTLMVVSVLAAPMIDIFSKLSAVTVAVPLIATMRFVLQTIFLVPFVLLRPKSTTPKKGLTKFHAARGLALTFSMLSFVATLKVMDVADAIAIFFVEPAILILMGSLLLKETVGWQRLFGCALGFVGALIVIRPSFDEVGWVAILPIVTAFCIATFALLTRILSGREDPYVMQMKAGIWGALFSAIAMVLLGPHGLDLYSYEWPQAVPMVYLTACAFFATTSGILAAYAYRVAPASTLAPLQYLEIVSATIFGWLVFGDFPDALKWVGILVIIGSGLFIIWSERKRAGLVKDLPAELAP